MTANEIADAFDYCSEGSEGDGDEFLKFERIPEADRRHKRPDLCAFLLLAELFDGESKGIPGAYMDIVSGADHDEIFLDPKIDDNTPLTKEHIIYLSRCGVRWDSDNECLAMFV